MLKLFYVLPICLFVLAVAPARADLCRKPGGGVEPCGVIPSSWTECGTFQDETVWCWPSASSKTHSKTQNATTTILISAAVGVAFVGIMWYLFKTPKSSNYDGQVKLMEF